MGRLWLMLIMIATLSLRSTADSSPLDLSVPHYEIGERMAVFEDTTGKMECADIAHLPASAFVPLGKPVDSHLFTTSVYWYRFEVLNPTASALPRLIVLEIPWLDVIKISVLDHRGIRSCYEGGDTYVYADRVVKNHLPNFEHRFVPGMSTVYLRVQTRDPFVVPVSIMDRTTFLEQAEVKWGHIAFIYGMIVAMMLYNLFLFISIKTRYYAFYVLYLVFFLAMNASYKCYTFEWFFADDPMLQNWAESTTIYLFSISGLLFAQSFLNLKTYFPRLNRLTIGLIVVFVATMLVTFAAGYHYHVMLSIMLSVVFSLYMFALGVFVLRRGYRFARFFLLGTSAGLIGTTVTALTVMAVLPYREAGFHAIDYGLVIDAILLSLALAERVKIVQKEKQIAQTEAKTDMLTGLLNRRAYDEVTSAEMDRMKRCGGAMSLIVMDIDRFKTVNDTYGHAGGDAVLRTISALIQSHIRDNDYLFRYGGEEFLILLPGTAIEDASVQAERIRIEIETARIPYQEQELRVTVSLGIAECTESDATIDDIERRADRRLYRAKQEGRNKSVSEG